METYNPSTAADLRRILRTAPPAYLHHLETYYRTRGGPGAELVAEELAYRARPQHCQLLPEAKAA